MSDSGGFRHQFLLAMPGMDDPRWAGSILYVCEHDANGAMALVINRPSDMTLLALFAQLGLPTPTALADRPVLDGGPVARDRGFVLHSDDCRFSASVDLGTGLRLSATRDALEAIAAGNGPERFIVALGCAGWGPGQLEQELLDNVWLTCPVDPTVIFEVPFRERVNRAATALGIDFRRLSGQAGHA